MCCGATCVPQLIWGRVTHLADWDRQFFPSLPEPNMVATEQFLCHVYDCHFRVFQAPANHLISASVMSAPAALAMSKLFYPETKKSRTTAKDVASMEKGCVTNRRVNSCGLLSL